MNPKFALVQIGKSTNVFIDGKYITNGIEDLNYHARNEKNSFKCGKVSSVFKRKR